MNRKDFLKFGSGALMMSAMPFGARAVEKKVPEFAKGAEELPPILDDFEYGRNPALKGRYASFFIDDAIWFLRDIARMRPKSLFDNPFLKPLKEYHDRYGLKLQINLFYRTDFFYGMDEFSLREVPDAYKAEWQANKDWLKLGFHSLQEFPDYPWLNIDGDDVRKLFGMIKGEIDRFAGEGVFTTALVPHWCPMSEAGCRAMKELGIKIMECSVGARYRYDGVRTRLPYGHVQPHLAGAGGAHRAFAQLCARPPHGDALQASLLRCAVSQPRGRADAPGRHQQDSRTGTPLLLAA